MIETYLLEQLLAFAEHGTLSAASESLHITQPTLSRSMQKLEQELEVTLFERTKNRMALNENGKLAAEYADRILHLQDEMATRIHALDRSRNTISIGASAPGPLMELVPAITRLYSGTTLSSELKEEVELLEGLDHDLYQLIVLDHEVSGDGLVSIPYGSESLYVSLPPAHPAAMYDEVSFHAMDGETFIMNANVGFWEEITVRNMPHSRLIKQSSPEDLSQLVQASSLPSFVTDLTLRIYGPQENRVAVPFSDDDATAHYYVICKKENQKRFAALLAQ